MEHPHQALFDRVRAALLAEVPHLWAIYIYGSLARGDDRPNSDLDVGILLPPGQRLSDPLATAAQVAEAANYREVDVVDLRRAGNFLRKEVLADGVLLYARNPEEVLAWEASALSEYGDHRERIRDILKDFENTGIGYAQ